MTITHFGLTADARNETYFAFPATAARNATTGKILVEEVRPERTYEQNITLGRPT